MGAQGCSVSRGKQTHQAGLLAILIVGGVLGSLFSYPLNLLSLASVVAAVVYLADVRPAVREVSGGSRW